MRPSQNALERLFGVTFDFLPLVLQSVELDLFGSEHSANFLPTEGQPSEQHKERLTHAAFRPKQKRRKPPTPKEEQRSEKEQRTASRH